MKRLENIETLRKEAEKCIGCGLCTYYCPVYAEEPDEGYVARGRNRLVREVIDDCRDLNTGLKDRFSKCLLCRRCTMVCPQAVRTDLITVAARAEIAKEEGLPIYKSMAFRKLLKDRNRMRKALRAASKLQRLLPLTREPEGKIHHIPLQKEGKIRHIPQFLAGMGGGRQLPSIAETSLSEQIHESNPPPASVKNRNIRAAYFSGCATEFIFPEVGKAIVRILNQLGVEVVFPKEQGCCGIAVIASGDLKTAKDMALHNIDVFSKFDVDMIVTGCATCGSALKDGWESCLSENEEGKVKFQKFGSRVKDISELLVDLADFKPLAYRSRLPENTKVTYHDPCHLARYQGVKDQPRKILRQVFGKNFVEMDNVGCCGMGGSFNIDHFSLSKKIAKKKVDSIARTGTDVVINTCPGCMIQLIDNIERYQLPQRVLHMVEAIEPIP
jgi:glycolate oxidase iron-sulfur subunit